MLRIRLTRVGKKNSPAYRVVVADKKRAVKRKFIEVIGHYNPTLNPKEIVIQKERALFWIQYGAQPSDTVNNLMCDLGILDKKQKVTKKYAKKLSKKAIKEGPAETPKAVEKEAAPEAEVTEKTEAAETTEPTPEKTETPEEEPTEATPKAPAEPEEEPEEAKTEE